ncbi:MAG TPA: DEAD/DEAH box helicase [Acidimicrobiales bacterium]|nr:DEAD/DEAH box helicase [Acidimicrobiales bacterium]
MLAVLDRQGILEPFPIQELTIRDGLAGRHVCGKAKTGSGKTLAFGLPVLQRLLEQSVERPDQRVLRGLVLVPTRELAQQVATVLKPLGHAVGLEVAAFYGGAAMDRQLKTAQKGVDVVVATPGRLIDLIERKAVRLDRLESVVIDEADRMADMGFMPQVEWLLSRLGAAKPQMLLFSATLDNQVDHLVRRYLTDPVFHDVAPETHTVEDMVHRFLQVHELDRVKVAAAVIRGSARTILFVRTKRGADRLVKQLQREGVQAAAIHGDLRQNARERALRDFTVGKIEALVATDVAARGIHVDEVDVVVQFDPPEDHRAYLHRAGRTARAGREGVVATFLLWNQQRDVEKIQKRLALTDPIIEVFSNDPRLADLPTLTGPAPKRRVAS